MEYRIKIVLYMVRALHKVKTSLLNSLPLTRGVRVPQMPLQSGMGPTPCREYAIKLISRIIGSTMTSLN